MDDTLHRIKSYGWQAAEVGVLIVVLCCLVSILVGPEAGGYPTAVAENARAFFSGLPPGVTVGAGLIAVAWCVLTRRGLT